MKTHKKPAKNSTPEQEERRRTTTKSERTAHSSLTYREAKDKKIIDAEEEQKRKAQDDSERLTVDCRISADASILNIISKAGIQNQIGMLMETTAKAARSTLLRAADSIGRGTETFETACMEIHLRFAEPETVFQICRTEESEHGKN